MDPEMMNSAGAAAPSADSAAPMPTEGADEGDTGPLSKMEIEPAEDGGAVVTHHPKVPERVKNMDEKSVKPRKHVIKNHEEMSKHMDKHYKRLKP